jgi:hypothetical protein
MERTLIDVIYDDNRAAVDFLNQRNEISLASDVENKLTKLLLFSAASFFESEIQDAMRDLVARASNNHEPLMTLAKQAIERKYHTYFEWEGNNANRFFRMLGPAFFNQCRDSVAAQERLQNAIRAFLELGNIRNELAHLDFAAFSLEKTAEEVYALYKSAGEFVDFVRLRLREA